MAFSYVPEMRCASIQIGGVCNPSEKIRNSSVVKNVGDTKCCPCEICARDQGATAICVWCSHLIQALHQTITGPFTKRKCHPGCGQKNTPRRSTRRKLGNSKPHLR